MNPKSIVIYGKNQIITSNGSYPLPYKTQGKNQRISVDNGIVEIIGDVDYIYITDEINEVFIKNSQIKKLYINSPITKLVLYEVNISEFNCDTSKLSNLSYLSSCVNGHKSVHHIKEFDNIKILLSDTNIKKKSHKHIDIYDDDFR